MKQRIVQWLYHWCDGVIWFFWDLWYWGPHGPVMNPEKYREQNPRLVALAVIILVAIFIALITLIDCVIHVLRHWPT